MVSRPRNQTRTEPIAIQDYFHVGASTSSSEKSSLGKYNFLIKFLPTMDSCALLNTLCFSCLKTPLNQIPCSNIDRNLPLIEQSSRCFQPIFSDLIHCSKLFLFSGKNIISRICQSLCVLLFTLKMLLQD